MMVERRGFSLMEVMAAIACMGIVLTVLSGLEIMLLRSVQHDTQALKRSALLGLFWQEARMQDADEYTKNYEDARGAYKRVPVAKESALASVRNLVLEHVELQYTVGGRDRRDVGISVWYKKPEEKNENESRLQPHRDSGSNRVI